MVLADSRMENQPSGTYWDAETQTPVQPPETELQFAVERAWGSQVRCMTLSTTFRHSGWRRDRSLIYHALDRTGQPMGRRDEFAQCGSHAYVLRSLDDPTRHRLAGSSCHDRFCLPCAKERSHAIALNVIERIQKKEVRFLTLTVRSTNETLTELLDKLYTSFQALRRRVFWGKHVRGGVAFLEIKWNPQANRWHPHFHVLMQGRYMPKQALKSLWYEITGDSYIIDIRLVRDSTAAGQYVAKYASKPFNSSFVGRPHRLDEAILSLKGRKLVLTFGTWRGVTVARTVSDDAWESVGSLHDFITRAAHGDEYCHDVLTALTDLCLDDLYARAPPVPDFPPALPPRQDQLTWFGVWQSDGGYTNTPSHPYAE